MTSIHRSAYKHGVTPDEMFHAMRLNLRRFSNGDMTISIGPDFSGNLLEIGTFEEGDSFIIVHAMRAQEKYLR